MNANREHTYKEALVQHLHSAESHSALQQILDNLLTPAEFSEISKRLQIFNLLQEGIPQRQIAEELGVGIATVTRGSRALKEQQSI